MTMRRGARRRCLEVAARMVMEAVEAIRSTSLRRVRWEVAWRMLCDGSCRGEEEVETAERQRRRD